MMNVNDIDQHHQILVCVERLMIVNHIDNHQIVMCVWRWWWMSITLMTTTRNWCLCKDDDECQSHWSPPPDSDVCGETWWWMSRYNCTSDALLLFFQADEDSLLPQASQEGYQFDPNAQIPQEGFKFWHWPLACNLLTLYKVATSSKLDIHTETVGTLTGRHKSPDLLQAWHHRWTLDLGIIPSSPAWLLICCIWAATSSPVRGASVLYIIVFSFGAQLAQWTPAGVISITAEC